MPSLEELSELAVTLLRRAEAAERRVQLAEAEVLRLHALLGKARVPNETVVALTNAAQSFRFVADELLLALSDSVARHPANGIRDTVALHLLTE